MSATLKFSSGEQIHSDNRTAIKVVAEIPISANTFIYKYEGPGSPIERIGEDGIENWVSAETIFGIHFRLNAANRINVSLRLRIPQNSESAFRFVQIDEEAEDPPEYLVSISNAEGGEYQIVPVGEFNITKPGYVQFNIQGMEKTGEFYADISHLLLNHTLEEDEVIFNVSEEAYFGRRGPSVHLRYPFPETEYSAEYFYNEVTVPEGNDTMGLYAMATGFSGGYFGMQVNGSVDRRVLFSVWSEYESDDPGQIPDEYKVVPLRKGQGVFVGEFGNEGAGAQSYVKFMWTAGTTYKFLVHARPLDDDNTLYAAWFKRPESEDWQLVASFRKPKVSTYLRGIYSFLENFQPEHGHLERRVLYGNQWARDSTGEWHELIQANFTGDATSRMGRRDFAGGMPEDGSNLFYLRHCGFFSNYVETGQSFFRDAEGRVPEVDIEALP